MDLETLWFILIAILWGGYFLLEGFDFGVGMLLPVLGRSREDRDAMFESIGPVWDGNEVWLVTAGAATFAAFPAWYATMFSGFYLALLLVLVFLILRVCSFEWRHKSESPRWRATWEWLNTISSIGAPLVWGVALSNLLAGVPINASGDFTGNLIDLFTPYTVVVGLAVVALFAFHGAGYLAIRTSGDLERRAAGLARRLSLPVLLLGAIALAWTVATAIDRNDKDLFPPVLPAGIGAVALALAALFAARERPGRAFAMTSLATLAVVATIFTGLYPRVMVSSTEFAFSLTVAGSASASYTLQVMTVVAAIFLPIVVLYQAWTYHVFRARVGGGTPAGNPLDLLPAATKEAER